MSAAQQVEPHPLPQRTNNGSPPRRGPSFLASRRLRRYVPILDWLPRYDRSRLRPDLIAGCVVAALAVPQALGYATIAGVPVELGLYAVPVALIAAGHLLMPLLWPA